MKMDRQILEIRVQWNNKQFTNRIVEVRGDCLLSGCISYVNQTIADSKIQSQLGLEVLAVFITKMNLNSLPVPASIRFSNICGRISHRDEFHQLTRGKDVCWTVYKTQFRGALSEVTNAFGRNASLYAVSANFNTSEKQQFTLFKGGVKSSQIIEEIKHVFDCNSIDNVTIHMVVATGKLDHFVSASSFFLDDYYKRQKNVSCTTLCVENEAGKRLRLQDVSKSFNESNNIPVEISIKDILITVGYRGNVNIFFTFENEVDISMHLEDKLMHACTKIMENVHNYT